MRKPRAGELFLGAMRIAALATSLAMIGLSRASGRDRLLERIGLCECPA
jgi:hypothetical protein